MRLPDSVGRRRHWRGAVTLIGLVLVSVARCGEIPADFVVGVLSPGTESDSLEFAAARTAAASVDVQGLMGPNHTITLVQADSGCRSGQTLASAAQLFFERRAAAFLGPGCCDAAESLATFAGALDVVSIGYRCQKAFSSAHSMYPTYSRLIPLLTTVHHPIVAVFREFEWEHVVIISTSDDTFGGMSYALEGKLEQNGIRVGLVQRLPLLHSESDRVRALRRLASTGVRIVLVMAPVEDSQAILLTAADEAMTGQGWAWVGLEFPGDFARSDARLAEAADGLLSINSIPWASSDPTTQGFLERVFAQSDNFTRTGSTVRDALLIRDAVTLLAMAFNASLSAGEDPFDSSTLIAYMAATVFNGTSGTVKLSSTAERQPLWQLYNFRKTLGGDRCGAPCNHEFLPESTCTAVYNRSTSAFDFGCAVSFNGPAGYVPVDLVASTADVSLSAQVFCATITLAFAAVALTSLVYAFLKRSSRFFLYSSCCVATSLCYGVVCLSVFVMVAGFRPKAEKQSALCTVRSTFVYAAATFVLGGLLGGFRAIQRAYRDQLEWERRAGPQVAVPSSSAFSPTSVRAVPIHIANVSVQKSVTEEPCRELPVAAGKASGWVVGPMLVFVILMHALAPREANVNDSSRFVLCSSDSDAWAIVMRIAVMLLCLGNLREVVALRRLRTAFNESRRLCVCAASVSVLFLLYAAFTEHVDHELKDYDDIYFVTAGWAILIQVFTMGLVVCPNLFVAMVDPALTQRNYQLSRVVLARLSEHGSPVAAGAMVAAAGAAASAGAGAGAGSADALCEPPSVSNARNYRASSRSPTPTPEIEEIELAVTDVPNNEHGAVDCAPSLRASGPPPEAQVDFPLAEQQGGVVAAQGGENAPIPLAAASPRACPPGAAAPHDSEAVWNELISLRTEVRRLRQEVDHHRYLARNPNPFGTR